MAKEKASATERTVRWAVLVFAAVCVAAGFAGTNALHAEEASLTPPETTVFVGDLQDAKVLFFFSTAMYEGAEQPFEIDRPVYVRGDLAEALARSLVTRARIVEVCSLVHISQWVYVAPANGERKKHCKSFIPVVEQGTK